MSTKTALPPRDTLPDEYKWNDQSLFETRQGWFDLFEEVKEALPQLAAFEDRLAEGPEVLIQFLGLLDTTLMDLNRLRAYTSMASNVDTNDQQATAMASQIQGLGASLYGAIAFMDPELLDIGQDTLQAWMAAHDELAELAHYVDDLFRKQAHIREAKVEQVLGLASGPFYGTYQAYSSLANADLTFAPAQTTEGDEVTIGQSNIRQIMYSADRQLRQTGWNAYRNGFVGVKNTLAALYSTRVKQAVFEMQVRGHESTLAGALHDSHVPVGVFHNLIETYQANLDTWHRYWRIRREALGYDVLHPYDVWAPLSTATPDVPYEQAVDWISAGLAPLGDEYVAVMRRGCLEERWVDVYPNHGKRLGAFSSGAQGTLPFIMMSYSDDLQGMSTLAHELGHSLHSYFTWENQPWLYARYSMFVAEVASNFNQAMTRAYLLDTYDDPEFQIAVIEEAMANFYRYFFVMPNLARFEYEVHTRITQGQGLTADDLIGIMVGLLEEGYGSDMHVDHDRLGIEWGTFGHLYVPFYTFQYATGISGAHALSARVLSGEAGAAEDYLAFLKLGGSQYPIDALKVAGVDLSTPQPVEETFGVMVSMIDRLEELVASR